MILELLVQALAPLHMSIKNLPTLINSVSTRALYTNYIVYSYDSGRERFGQALCLDFALGP